MFDGRVPHGVRVVEGTHDVREARLVVHGWFLDPAPFFEGALSEEAAAEALNAGLEALYEARYYVRGGAACGRRCCMREARYEEGTV